MTSLLVGHLAPFATPSTVQAQSLDESAFETTPTETTTTNATTILYLPLVSKEWSPSQSTPPVIPSPTAPVALPPGFAALIPPGLTVLTSQPTAENESALIGPAGAAVLFLDKRVAVIANAGTYTETVRLTLRKGADIPGTTMSLPMHFTLEAVRAQSGEPVENFAQPVRLVTDLRGLEGAASDQNWHLVYGDPSIQGLWYPTHVEVHDLAGLISTQTTHFSDWMAGVEPSPWQYRWNPPTVAQFSGAATYQYPIAVPAGRGGLTPKVDLAYSSRGVDGLLQSGTEQGPIALGWAMNNIEITRDEVHYHCCQDYRSVLVLPDRFSLVLNGASYELKADGDTTGTDVRYYAKDGPGLLIRRLSLDGETFYWIVKTSDGTTYRLGYLPEARSHQNGEPRAVAGHLGTGIRWRVDTVTDVSGNQVQYFYDDSWTGDQRSEQRRLTDIRYNFETPAPDAMTRVFSQALSRIVLVDADRDHRVERIEVYHFGALVRVINLQLGFYQPDLSWNGGASTRTNVVLSITEESAIGERLPTTTFTYALKPHFDDGYRYAYLEEMQNGYGGRTRFTYQSDGRQRKQEIDHRDFSYGQSYFVTKAETWDGLNADPISQDYQYQTPCYNNSEGGPLGNLALAFDCPTSDPAEAPGVPVYRSIGGLVGFETITVTVRDYGNPGPVLSKSFTQFHQDRENTGRPVVEKVLGPYDGLLKQTETIYGAQPNGSTTFTFASVVTGTAVENGVTTSQPTSYAYDAYGNQTEQVTYDQSGQPYRRTFSEYIPNVTNGNWIVGKPARQQVFARMGNTWSNASLSETWYNYDADENPAYNTPPNSLGRLMAVRQRQDHAGQFFVDTRYTYDQWGNALTETTFNNLGTATAYASADPRVTALEYEHGLYRQEVTNPLNQTVSYDYDLRLGLPLTVTNANLVSTYYRYDSFGRLTQVIRPGDSLELPSVEYRYFDNTMPLKFETRQRTVGGCADCVQRAYQFYDALGRLIQSRAEAENGQQIVGNVIYDARGLTTLSYQPALESFSENFARPAGWDARPYSTTRYDALGRAIVVTNTDSTQVQTAYRGLETGVLDANGHQRISTTDIFGRLIAVKEYSATVPAIDFDRIPDTVTRYAYDHLDHLTVVTDTLQHTTVITYNVSGQKIAMDDPDMGIWTYQYNPIGSLQSQTDSRGVTMFFEYDRLNRLTTKRHTVPAGAPIASPGVVEYFYDEGGAPANALGQRTRMVDGSSMTTWQYDVRGRLLVETQTITDGLGSYALNYAYNNADQLISVTYPDGEIITTTYNARGLPVSLSTSLGGVYATDAAYDALGHLTSFTSGNNLPTRYDYYPIYQQGGRLRSVQVGNGLLDFTYSYDPVGNIQSIADRSASIGEQTLNFTYDAFDRLLTATAMGGAIPGYNHRYDYDLIGRIESKTIDGQTLEYSYSPIHPHAATAMGDNAYTYDAAGNMTTRIENGVVYTQTWNADGKLARVEWMEAGHAYSTTFVYDGEGSRILKIEDDGATEITTVYIGGVFEKMFDTTSDDLSQQLLRLGIGRMSTPKGHGLAKPAMQATCAGSPPAGGRYRCTDPGGGRYRDEPGTAQPGWPNCTYNPEEYMGYEYCRTDSGGVWHWYDPAPYWEGPLPAPTVSGSVNCTAGTNGWCKSTATLSITGYEPLAGYSIIRIEGNRNGTPFTYGGATASIPVTDTPGATFTYRAVSSDNYASAYGTTVIKVDSVAPATLHSLSGTSGTNGWYVSPVMVTLSASDATSGIASTTLEGSTYTGPRTYSGNGTFTYQYRSTDNAGNAEALKSLSLKIDTVAPANPSTVNPGCVASGGVWQNTCGDASFTWSGASDATSGVSGYYVYFGMDTAGTASTFQTSAAYDPPAISASGAYHLRVATRDNAGNTAPWATLFTLRFDNTLPQNPTAAMATSGAITSGVWQNTLSAPVFNWAGSDLHSGLNGYSVYFGSDSAGTSSNFITTLPYTPTALTTTGQYYLRVRAMDNVGNLASGWQTIFVVAYDVTPPSNPIGATETSGQGAQSGVWQNAVNLPAFSWTPGAGDSESGVASYDVYWGAASDGVTPITTTTASTFTAPGAVASGSVYYLRLRSRDAVGNVSNWTTLYTFQYDGVAPQVSALLPDDGAVLTTTQPALTATLVDPAPESGLLAPTLVLDGQLITPTLTSGSFVYTPTLTPGAHYFTLHARDAAGNITTVGPHVFTVDPDTWIHITSPQHNAVLNQTSTALALDVEPGALITITVGANVLTSTAARRSWTISGIPLQTGLNTITAEARDHAGNLASDSVTVAVDPEQATALVYASSSAFNPEIRPMLFYVTALPGTNSTLETWRLNIRDASLNTVAVISGTSALDHQPALWDGRTTAGAFAPDGAYTYQLVIAASTSVATSAEGALNVSRAAPSLPALACGANGQTWFSEPPALASGAAPEGAHVVVYLDGRPLIVAPVYAGQWQAAIPLTEGAPYSTTVTVRAVDAAGNTSPASNACQMGLERRDPFVAPHANLSANFIGLNTRVTLTATTRINGAPIAWVQATVPAAATPLTMTTQSAGRYTAAWQTPASGTFEGIAIVRFDAEDTSSPLPNHGAQFVQPYLDLLPPATALTWPPVGYAQTDSQLTVQGTSEALSTIVITATRGAQSVTTSATSDALGHWSAALTLPDGVYALSAQATDLGGNTGPATAPIMATIDTSGPMIGALAMEPQYVQPGRTVTLTTTIRDAVSGVREAEARIAGWPSTLSLDPVIGDQYRTIALIDPNAAEGQQAVTVQAWDALNNTSVVTDSGFIVDGASPALSAPALVVTATNVVLTGTTLYYGPNTVGQVTTRLTAGDDSVLVTTAGLEALSFPSIFDNDGQTLTLNGVRTAAEYSHAYVITGTASGLYTVQAADRAGNTADSLAFRVLYDSTAPTVTLHVPASAGLRFPPSWSAADEGAGVQAFDLEYREGAGEWTGWFTATTQTQAHFIAQLDHTYTFRVRATDRVGNVSAWQEVGPVTIHAVTKYYTFNGQRVAMRQGDAVYYLHGDHLGSASLVTDANRKVVSETRYLPFGGERWANGAAVTDFGFTGQRAERGFGLMDYNARFYSPGLGMFVSADTMVPAPGIPQNINRYAYTLNNPLKYNDPDGHCVPLCTMAAGAVIGFGISYGLQAYNNYQHNGGNLQAALTTNIDTTQLIQGALLGAMAGAIIPAIPAFVAAGTELVLGATAGLACADGDCTNEVQAGVKAVTATCGGDCSDEAQSATKALPDIQLTDGNYFVDGGLRVRNLMTSGANVRIYGGGLDCEQCLLGGEAHSNIWAQGAVNIGQHVAGNDGGLTLNALDDISIGGDVAGRYIFRQSIAIVDGIINEIARFDSRAWYRAE